MTAPELLQTLEKQPVVENKKDTLSLPVHAEVDSEPNSPDTKLVHCLYNNLSGKSDVSAKQRLASIADHAPIALVNINGNGSVLSANKACKSIIGIPSSILIGDCLFHYLTEASNKTLQSVLTDIGPNSICKELILEFVGSPMEIAHMSVHISAYTDDDAGCLEFILSFSDASREKKIADQLRKTKAYLENMVTKDALTGLPNRLHFVETLRAAMLNARKINRKIALLYFDIDGFKSVNDRHGHLAGDLLLCEMANRLKIRIRDVGRLARLGGDEFTLILDYAGSEAQLQSEAQKVLNAIAEPTTISSAKMNVSASIGIAQYPGYAKTPEQLIHYADVAMYRAKEAGGNQAVVFCKKHYEKITRASALVRGMESGIKNSEFYLEFQPIVDSVSYSIDSFEVLTRWNHPEYGNISPKEFIGIAEKSDQITQLSNWVIETAFIKLKELLTAGIDTRFAINISALLISDKGFPAMLLDQMKRFEIPPGSVEFEITETGIIDELDNAISLANELHKYGSTLSVDDFGTGYSSLARLTRLPVNRIKLDQLFVSELTNSKESRIIVEAIIKIAHDLGLGVVAEGVENSMQSEMLQEIGCQYLQGFKFSKPCSEEKLGLLLKKDFASTSQTVAC